MYRIPENYNIDALIGETIFQIAFGLNFITLFFNGGYIQLEGAFATTFDNNTREYDEVYPVKSDFGLLQLLEHKIVGVKVNSNRDVVSLLFENGSSLKLIGNENYESYVISLSNNEIRV
jgi:hypothetical protein